MSALTAITLCFSVNGLGFRPTPTLARLCVPASLLVLARTRFFPSPAIFLAREATLLRLLPLGPKPLRPRWQPSPVRFLFLVPRRSPLTTQHPAGSYRDIVADSAVPASSLVLFGASVRPSPSSSSLVFPVPVPLQGSSGSAPIPWATATFPGTPTFLAAPQFSLGACCPTALG